MTTTTDVGEDDRNSWRREFWESYHAAYAELRADTDAWTDHLREGEAWDVTLADGPEIGPDEDQDGECPPNTRE